MDLAGGRVDDGDGLAGIIDKDFLATFMGQAHGGRQVLGPLPVEGTELAVPVAVRLRFAILDPQQPQSGTLPAKLGVNQSPVGTGNDPRTGLWRRGEKELVQGILTHVSGERPVQSRFLRTLQILGHGAVGDGATPGDGPVRQSAFPLQTENFSYFAHGQPVLGHLCLLYVSEA
jgi:hypothetical protein